MEVGLRPEVNTTYGRYVAAQAGSSLQHLIYLDELWTIELEQATGRGRLGEVELVGLQHLAREMERTLDGGRASIESLRELLNGAEDDQVDQAFRSIAQSEGSPGSIREMPSQLDSYEIRSSAIAGCDYMLATALDEAALLRQKVETILEVGEIPPGDLRAAFRCAALIALVGAGTVSLIGLGGPAGLIAAGAISQVGLGALAWMQENCNAQIAAFTFGRRE